MPMFLGRFSYSSESIKALVDNPVDRTDTISATAESVGGSLHGFWYAFGEWDGYFLFEAPDQATAVAFSATVGGTGALTRIETIPLMSIEEGVEAFRKAQSASYSPPGG
jgi:uncharacterized protein with GYD domain